MTMLLHSLVKGIRLNISILSTNTSSRPPYIIHTNIHPFTRPFLPSNIPLLFISTTSSFNALLSGYSAGGLVSILHCDEFREPFPATTKVKCLSDAYLVKSGGFTICSNEAGFRNQMLDAIKGVSKYNKNGLFINSCFAHCQSERQDTWFADDSPMIQDKSVALSVGEWFFDRVGRQEQRRSLIAFPILLGRQASHIADICDRLSPLIVVTWQSRIVD
ncbi:hypothetical protein Syun_021109 [Stephania yunnanensis]|uniref:Pectin acetylesterase n=1 Tax=Stephania yunnanensis TaxID=152371 RepID=A0AAP0IFF6_9MAGN